MEQLEIHSKSYLVRWVSIEEEHTISWSVRPDKKSINFGIFKHPGKDNSIPPDETSSTIVPPPTPGLSTDKNFLDSSTARSESSNAAEKLKAIGLKLVLWYGSCEANRVSTGKYDVPIGESGMYALVFDNTFAKQFSKTATFVLLTYPTDSPPQLDHHAQHINGGITGSAKAGSQVKQIRKAVSSDAVPQSVPRAIEGEPGKLSVGKPLAALGTSDDRFLTGMLQKRRRKRHQGWARRFFSLDYTTSTLSYYHNRNALSMRGAIPLSLAAVSCNADTLKISIDSGAEIWHLRATSRKDFDAWKRALEVSRSPSNIMTMPAKGDSSENAKRGALAVRASGHEEREWNKVSGLVDRIKESRNAARLLARDSDPRYLPVPEERRPAIGKVDSNALSSASSNSGSPSEQSINGYFMDGANDRRPFWRRKRSSERAMNAVFRRSVSATPSTTSLRTGPPTPNQESFQSDTKTLASHPEESLHLQCMTLLKDLDQIVADFDLVLHETKARQSSLIQSSLPRHSIDSLDEVFYDVEGFDNSQILNIHQESGDDSSGREYVSDEGSSSESEDEVPVASIHQRQPSFRATSAFPRQTDPPVAMPIPAQVKRRTVITAPKVAPPSLISFLRKNVGKDLSTVSTPVTANEPLSLLQRTAEMLEYSRLLDKAAMTKDGKERLLLMTAFAITPLAGSRVKERAMRKPFNPMLGETFELIREDLGFRFLAEKVSHRPVTIACQAESARWIMTHAPSPSQKFWGKSAEIITEGKVRISLPGTDDRFSWTPPTCFLRNVIAGEKYVEPTGSMTIYNESNGETAVVTFKAGGMFSGRSEDITVEVFESDGRQSPLGMLGKWITSISVTEDSMVRKDAEPIWTASTLPNNAVKCYGFSSFALSLNEVTAMEKGKLPVTDSRLRPDQRALEDGNIHQGESLKMKLEDAQRSRRKVTEEEGTTHKATWFETVSLDDGEEAWVQKQGSTDYWHSRETGQWPNVVPLFNV